MVKDDNKPDALELVIVSHTESLRYSILLWQEPLCLAYTNLTNFCRSHVYVRRTIHDWGKLIIFYLADTGSPFSVVAWITCSIILPPAAIHHHISQTCWRCISIRNISLLLFRFWDAWDRCTHVVTGRNKHVWSTPSFIRHNIQFDL